VTRESELLRLRGVIDEPGFTAALGEHLWFTDLLIGVLPLVQKRPSLIASLRAGVPDHRREDLERWLRRTLLTLPTPHTMENFCELATSRARRVVPAFPALDPGALVETWRFYCGYRREADARVGGVGWTLFFESADVGPGECIHIEEWTATAWGPGLVLTRAQTDGSVTLWEESQGR
jgi:hypothetical protein